MDVIIHTTFATRLKFLVASRPLTTRLLKLPPEAPAAAAAAASQAHAGLAHGHGPVIRRDGQLESALPSGRRGAGQLERTCCVAAALQAALLCRALPPPGAAGAPASQLLPVSAVTVNAAPDRASGAAAAPSGADIVEDALAEERTARRAARFMASGDASSLQQ